MAKKGKGGGLFGGPVKHLFTAFWILTILGGLLAFFNVNNIKTPGDLWAYAKQWSDDVSECYDESGEHVTWACNEMPSGPTGKETSPGSSGPSTPNIPEVNFTELEDKLNSLVTKPSQKVSYDRSEWKHWSKLGTNCNARIETLKNQGTNIKTDSNNSCKIISGVWMSPYENAKFTDPSKLDIDHVIPLAYTARNGGQNWDLAKKEQFANDPIHLLATSASENRKKSDKGPAEYMPPEAEYWCSYSTIWVETASKYKLSIPQEDKEVLEEGLASC